MDPKVAVQRRRRLPASSCMASMPSSRYVIVLLSLASLWLESTTISVNAAAVSNNGPIREQQYQQQQHRMLFEDPDSETTIDIPEDEKFWIDEPPPPMVDPNPLGPPLAAASPGATSLIEQEETIVSEKEIEDEDTKNFNEQDAIDTEDDLGVDLTDNPIFLDPTGPVEQPPVPEGDLEGELVASDAAAGDGSGMEEDEYMDVNEGIEKLAQEAAENEERASKETKEEEIPTPLITSPNTLYPQSHRSAWVAHGTVGAIIFGLLVPTAISSALFRDLIPSYWIYIHVCVNVITFAMTFFTVGIAFATMNGMGAAGEGHMKELHHIIGLLLLLLVSFQTANGFLRPPREFVTEDEHDTTPGAILRSKLENGGSMTARALWQLVHRGSGLLIFFLGAYQVSSGLGLFAARFGTPDWGSVYVGYIAWLTGVIFVAKIYYFIKGRRNAKLMKDMELQLGGRQSSSVLNGSIGGSGGRGVGIHSNLGYDPESDFAMAESEYA